MLFRAIQPVILVLLLLSQYYCIRKISANTLKLRRFSPGFFLLLAFVLCMDVPLVILLIWSPKIIAPTKLQTYMLIYPFYVWQFGFFLAGLILLIVGILRLPLIAGRWIAAKLRRGRALRANTAVELSVPLDERRRFLRQGVTILVGASFTASAYGAFRKDEFETTLIPVPIKNLPESFEGFSIALLSDIHSSIFMTKEMMIEYADAVNNLHADMIAVTGDFVNSQVEEVYPFAEAFERLRAPSGVFGVLGNHDYYSRNVEEVAKRVNECGIRLLINEQARIEKNGSSIYLLGSDDIGSVVRAEQSLDRAAAGIAKGTPKILMVHRPYYFETAEQRGMDLVLSGHTHGGQIVFAKFEDEIFAPARLASKYVAGMYTIGNSRMYVSRGIGTVGVPVRLNCPPEITKFVLTRG
jgi:hypothetical protein